jgi:hypothetical protein
MGIEPTGMMRSSFSTPTNVGAIVPLVFCMKFADQPGCGDKTSGIFAILSGVTAM